MYNEKKKTVKKRCIQVTPITPVTPINIHINHNTELPVQESHLFYLLLETYAILLVNSYIVNPFLISICNLYFIKFTNNS